MATAALQKRNYPKTIRTYMMLIIITLLLAGYYGYTQYVILSGAQDALAKEQTQITDLQTAENQAGTDYSNLKKDFDQKYADVLSSLQSVYPLQEDYTKLTIDLDKFFHDNNSSFNPVFLSDIKYGQARYDAGVDYAVLPVTMTITGTEDNFMKFLQFVENSGVLADKTRLMDIRSISINFTSTAAAQNPTSLQTSGSSTQTMINVSVALNAYFQKPFLQSTATTAAVTPTVVSS